MDAARRTANIDFIVWAIREVEGVDVRVYDFHDRTDEVIEELMEWYGYLLTK